MNTRKKIRLCSHLLISLLIIYILSQIFLFSIFKVPSSSMEPTLLNGDYIFVWKPIYGARLYNFLDLSEEKKIEIYRLPGISNVKRGDVVVFNSPYPQWDIWEKIEMSAKEFYVKRCTAISGDTICIRNGFYQINNIDNNFIIPKDNSEEIKWRFYKTLPYDSTLNWNIKYFGPMYIPKKGDCIEINRKNYLLYKRLIEWEQGEKVVICDSIAYLGNEALKFYTFNNNYYFMSGDNAMESIDSRHWGLVPEKFIVGKATYILKSFDKKVKRNRQKRILKKIE